MTTPTPHPSVPRRHVDDEPPSGDWDAVLAACCAGDREGFRLLFERYKDRVYSIALHWFGGDTTAAEDVTQQVFLKLIRTIGQFQNQSRFSTWLYRVVINACADERRRTRHWQPISALDKGRSMNPSAVDTSHDCALDAHGLPEAVQAGVGQLSPRLRSVILLRYFDDLSYEEMADVLGCSAGTVASRLNRAHKELARRLYHLRDAV